MDDDKINEKLCICINKIDAVYKKIDRLESDITRMYFYLVIGLLIASIIIII